METLHNAKCRTLHYGPWCIEPNWFLAAVESYRAGTVVVAEESVTGDVSPLYVKTDDGLAFVDVDGPMVKGGSKFGGTVNTMRLRRAVRAMAQDKDVLGAMMTMDTPGGTVAGTKDLADDMLVLGAEKPLFVHATDMLASAGMWIASSASRISATQQTEIGSIGTMAVIVDSSGQAAAEGLKVHVLSTGSHKGLLEDGVPVTDEALAYFQQRVDEQNDFFLRAVADGRKMRIDQVRKLADGKVMLATAAKDAGLIDAVEAYDVAVDKLRSTVGKAKGRRKSGGTYASELAFEELR